jgi:hypothetical protein
MPCQTCVELRRLNLNGEMTPYTCRECGLTSSSFVGKFKDEVDEDVVPFVGLRSIAYNYVDTSTQTNTCDSCGLLQCDCLDDRIELANNKEQKLYVFLVPHRVLKRLPFQCFEFIHELIRRDEIPYMVVTELQNAWDVYHLDRCSHPLSHSCGCVNKIEHFQVDKQDKGKWYSSQLETFQVAGELRI